MIQASGRRARVGGRPNSRCRAHLRRLPPRAHRRRRRPRPCSLFGTDAAPCAAAEHAACGGAPAARQPLMRRVPLTGSGDCACAIFFCVARGAPAPRRAAPAGATRAADARRRRRCPTAWRLTPLGACGSRCGGPARRGSGAPPHWSPRALRAAPRAAVPQRLFVFDG